MLLGDEADQVEQVARGQLREWLALLVDCFVVILAGSVQAEEARELEPRLFTVTKTKKAIGIDTGIRVGINLFRLSSKFASNVKRGALEGRGGN